MVQARDHHRNQAAAYYDYQKAYTVNHYWVLRGNKWMGRERKVGNIIEEAIKKWKTRLEVRNENTLLKSQWIDIKKRFLQGDKYSPVGFLCTEIPATMLLEESDGYPMGSPSKREIERSRSLIIDDLKTYH